MGDTKKRLDFRVKGFPQRKITDREVPLKGLDEEIIRKSVDVQLRRMSAVYSPNEDVSKPGTSIAKPGTAVDDFALEIMALAARKANPNLVDPHMFLGAYEVERDVIEMTSALLNHPQPEKTGGFLLSGGSESILTAMWAYRNLYFNPLADSDVGRSIREEGLFNALSVPKQGFFNALLRKKITKKPVVLTHIGNHFSVEKSADILGIGTNNVVYYGLDENWHPDMDSLKAQLEGILKRDEGVAMSFATVGDVGRGIIPDVREISDVTAKVLGTGDEPVPLIVDAAGQYLFAALMKDSPNYGKRMPDWDFLVSDVRSIIVDPHKNGIPYPAGMLLYRTDNDQCLSDVAAGYLSVELLNGALEEGVKHRTNATSTVSTSRCGYAAFSTWAYYLKHGIEGMRAKKEGLWETTRLAAELIDDSDKFELQCMPETAVVGFTVNGKSSGAAHRIHDIINTSDKDFYYVGDSDMLQVRTVDDMIAYKEYSGGDRPWEGLYLYVMEHNTPEEAHGIVKRLEEVWN
ncbi:MAG: hypothetical protein GOU97_01280, partial [Nanoarchaeota archaeon]|nr:hypothetical protein [Nanoarchaeota archaeon]